VSSYQRIFEQIAHVAAPYVIFWQESRTRGGVIIELSDEGRERPEKTRQIMVSNEKIESTSDLSKLFTRAVSAVKKKLQEDLARECDEPELRLWLAQNRNADFMNNETVPANLRKLYQAHLNPPPPRRKVVRSEVEVAGEKEGLVPVKSNRGVPVKEQKRKPHCPVHTDTSMEYDEEGGKWRCPSPGCKLVARPKQDTPVGKLVMGKGQLDLRVVYPDDGGEPSLVLIADNNVALDITSIVDMEKFREFNDYPSAAARAKRAGESATTVRNQYTSALLRINKPAKVLGCEYS